jgi:hypothetical protein
LYAGGQFTHAGGVQAERIACWDPVSSTWSALGSGRCYGWVRGLTVLDGKLYAFGRLGCMDGGIDAAVASWDLDDQLWSALAVSQGRLGPTCGLASDGYLYVAGYFSTLAGVSANNIARWDPGSGIWQAVGAGTSSEVYSLAAVKGTLYAGGSFFRAGEQSSAYFARVEISPRADFDCDLDVDGTDFDAFQACTTGAAVPYDVLQLPAGCPASAESQSFIPADFDADGDVDQSDFGLFQRSITTGQ